MAHVSLKMILSEKFNVNPTQRQNKQLLDYCARYEVRADNPLAFNSPMLGVKKAYFLGKDSDAIFDIFNIYKNDFARSIKSCVGINKSFAVASNDFNLLIVWLLYNYTKSSLSKKEQYDGMYTLLKMLHYKFFTGKVNHSFKHGANEGVMQYTVDHLSAKCDIKKPATPTWKAVIEAHCKYMLEEDNLHAHTIRSFSPDDKIVYFLSDLHTRISTKIVIVARAYYNNHAQGKGIKDVDATMTNTEGEKELKALRPTLDNTITTIQNNVLNTNIFINYSDIKLASGIANIRPDMLREVLMTFSAVATQQYRNHTGDEIKLDKKKRKIYVGYRILISELIQKSYRRAVMSGCDMKSNVDILNKTRDAFKASRILDEDILLIKDSVHYFVQTNTKYTREATIIAIRMGIIMYLMIQSFKS